jgi:hypothetical protein
LRAIVLVLLVASAAPHVAGAAFDPIQPGDLYNGVCTLNFVFDGAGALAGNVYIGTAAHCVFDGVGEDASTTGNSNFGDVVFLGDVGEDENGVPGVQSDFALIQVRAAFEERVVADVRGHPGMPTGHTLSTATAAGDRLLLSGYGMGFDLTGATRENRTGVLTGDTPREYTADTLAVNGDSGGPVLRADGKALGVISQYNFVDLPPSTDVGPTVQGILAELSALGYPVTLRTAS